MLLEVQELPAEGGIVCAARAMDAILLKDTRCASVWLEIYEGTVYH